MFLDNIALAFYRGIGPEIQYIGPFSRLNLFIGPNNSGKSTVLNFLTGHFKQKIDGQNNSFSIEENYFGSKKGELFFAIGSNVEDFKEYFFEVIRKTNPSIRQSSDVIKRNIDELVKEISIDEAIYVSYSAGKIRLFPEIDKNGPLSSSFRAINHYLGGSSGINQHSYQIETVLSAIRASVQKQFADIYLIPAKRQIGEKGSSFDGLNGNGLIDHLDTLQNPAFHRQEDRVKFSKINAFLKSVTGKPDAELEVPSDCEYLIVHMDNKVLPLSSLGTGIHEVILIASFCTIYDESIICIEEPEIHLHPILQRKLINYIMKNTSSQYFIATHSSSFIDTEGASVFAVHNNSEQTYVTRAITKSDKKSILDSMGYLASDLLQANVVIWVEGPSDRIYMNHWISSYNSDLIEGIHYTIMFYGGSLIRHLAASDEAAEEFIHLQHLNRNMIVVFDSDKDADDAALKPNVKRVSEEIENNGGIAWITAGREIENYIDHRLLQSALAKVHPKIYDGPSKGGKFDNSFHFYRPDPKNNGKRKLYKEADKVGVAEYVCSYVANFDIYDLRARIGEVCDFIIRANRVD